MVLTSAFTSDHLKLSFGRIDLPTRILRGRGIVPLPTTMILGDFTKKRDQCWVVGWSAVRVEVTDWLQRWSRMP